MVENSLVVVLVRVADAGAEAAAAGTRRAIGERDVNKGEKAKRCC